MSVTFSSTPPISIYLELLQILRFTDVYFTRLTRFNSDLTDYCFLESKQVCIMMHFPIHRFTHSEFVSWIKARKA